MNYQIRRGGLTEFSDTEPFFTNGTSPTTDGNGVSHVEIDVTGRVPGKIFFPVE